MEGRSIGGPEDGERYIPRGEAGSIRKLEEIFSSELDPEALMEAMRIQFGEPRSDIVSDRPDMIQGSEQEFVREENDLSIKRIVLVGLVGSIVALGIDELFTQLIQALRNAH